MSNFFKRFFKKLAADEGFEASFVEVDIPSASANDYGTIISRVLPYYNQLNESNRQKFLKRVYNFKSAKTFYFMDSIGKKK